MSLVLLAASVLFAVAAYVYLDSALQRVPALTDYPGRVAESAGTNWLLVGSDSRQGLTQQQIKELDTGDQADAGGARTDTVMLLHVPSGHGAATLVSLPRDTLVSIDGHGENKLNAAYAFGGPMLLTRTVEEITGLRIDHYLEVGFGGFVGVTDAVGGVPMCLDGAVNDPLINLDLAPGCQVLDGDQALKYARSRHAFAGGDLDRIQHQRQFLTALVKKATSPGVLADPLHSVPMVLRGTQTLTLSDGDHVWTLASLGYALLRRGAPATATVPVGGSRNVAGGVGDTLLWDQAKSAQLFSALKQDKPIPPSAITGSGG